MAEVVKDGWSRWACLIGFGSLLFLSGCYEQRAGCLDPDASNYDLQADEACPDCCTFPGLSVRITTLWNDTAIVAGQSYQDAAGQDFQFVRFRYYLGELRVDAADTDLADPLRPVEVRELIGPGDTSEVFTVPGNYLLASLTPSTTDLGTITRSDADLSGLSGTFGLDDRYRRIVPASTPTDDPLRTQPGRLNYRDGRGYVQARLEYTLTPGGDTLSASSFASVPFALPFGLEQRPQRGLGIRLDVETRLADLIGAIELSSDTARVARQIAERAPESFMSVVGLAQ